MRAAWTTGPTALAPSSMPRSSRPVGAPLRQEDESRRRQPGLDSIERDAEW